MGSALAPDRFQWEDQAEGCPGGAGRGQFECGIDLTGEQLADRQAQSRAAGASAPAGNKKLLALRLGHTGSLVDDVKDETVARFLQRDLYNPAGRRSRDRVLHKVGCDKAQQAAAVTVEYSGEVRGHAERHAVLAGSGVVALMNGGSQFRGAHLLACVRTDIAQQGDGLLYHPLHQVSVVGGRFPVAVALRRDRGTQTGDGPLQAVNQMRSDLAEH
jgi:hypothetical protein